MKQEIIARIILLAIGLGLLLVPPARLWAVTQKWKTRGGGQPSRLYIIVIRILGTVFAVAGAVLAATGLCEKGKEERVMHRKLIQWLGLTGILALLSYTAAVIFSPMAYPGYSWMAQAVSDLSAETAPSRALWNQLSCLYGKCGIVSVMAACIYVSERKPGSKAFRTGIYLFAVMNWVSAVGYDLFPLSEAGVGMRTFSDIMHVYVVTAAVVLTSIVSLILIFIGGRGAKHTKGLARWALLALAMMFIGAIGTNIVPPQFFGVAERFSVFAAVGFNAILGWYLFEDFGNMRNEEGS